MEYRLFFLYLCLLLSVAEALRFENFPDQSQTPCLARFEPESQRNRKIRPLIAFTSKNSKTVETITGEFSLEKIFSILENTGKEIIDILRSTLDRNHDGKLDFADSRLAVTDFINFVPKSFSSVLGEMELKALSAMRPIFGGFGIIDATLACKSIMFPSAQEQSGNRSLQIGLGHLSAVDAGLKSASSSLLQIGSWDRRHFDSDRFDVTMHLSSADTALQAACEDIEEEVGSHTWRAVLWCGGTAFHAIFKDRSKLGPLLSVSMSAMAALLNLRLQVKYRRQLKAVEVAQRRHAAATTELAQLVATAAARGGS